MRCNPLMLVRLAVTVLLLPLLAAADPPQPVTMTASLAPSASQIGQPIVLEVDLHNSGTQEACIGMTADRESLFHFLITEASGRTVPRTALGDLSFTRLWAVAANAPVTIPAGATYRCCFNLTDLYGLLRTGHYTIVVSRVLGQFRLHAPVAVLAAAPLKFQIVKATTAPNILALPFIHDPSADENIP